MPVVYVTKDVEQKEHWAGALIAVSFVGFESTKQPEFPPLAAKGCEFNRSRHLEYQAAFDHHVDVAHHQHIVEWIAADGDQVAVAASHKCADIIL